MRRAFAAIAGAGLLFVVAGCATGEPPAPDGAARANAVEATAVVEAVNAERREVMVRTEDDRYLTVAAGPEVRNFEQIEVGDTVRTVYFESVAVEMAPEESDLDQSVVTATRAPAGTRPGAAVASRVATTVELVAYDEATGLATFTTPDGLTHSLVVAPEMRAFAARRQPGDRIDVLFTEAVAIVVEPSEG